MSSLAEPAAVGAVRKRPVDIVGSAYVPMAVPQKLSEEVETISALELEVRHRGDIHTCVKSYVESSVRQLARVRAHAYAVECFSAEPQELRTKLAERVAEIVAALNDANYIAYGIPKRLFGEYQSLPIPKDPDEKITEDFLGPGF
jgi:hypothetical protein